DGEGVQARTSRRLQKRAVDESVHFVDDLLPEPVRQRRRLLHLPEALREAHFPEKFADELAHGVPGGQPRRRLAFEELFLVQLGLALRRRGVKVEPGVAFRVSPEALERIVSALPWPLTGAQRRAVEAIAAGRRKAE